MRNAAAQARREAGARAKAREQAGTLDLQEVLALHVGTAVGMNFKDAVKIDEVLLVSAQADHFVVASDGLLVRTPYSRIRRITTATGDGSAKVSAFGGSFDLVIEVFQLVVYKGAVGVGMSMPI